MSKRKIKISEQELNEIIKESINDLLLKKSTGLLTEESTLYKFNQNEQNLEIKSFDMNNDEDKSYIKKHINEIWDLLQKGYEKIGGFKSFQTPKDLLKKTPFLRLGYCNENIVAIAVYNSYLGGNKCVGLTCVKDERHDISVKLLELVLEYDIVNWEQWVWIEASGKVEEMCKKLNAFNVPTEYAIIYLKNIPYEIQDEYHYTRKIAGKDEVKSIFGFRDMEIFEILKSDLNNKVDEFLKKIQEQKLNEHMSKQEQIYQRYLERKGICQKYKDIIDYFIYLHEDELINELPKESLNILENTISSLYELVNSGEQLSIDRKIIEITIMEGKALLNKFIVLYPIAV